jgi:hypothetical protein
MSLFLSNIIKQPWSSRFKVFLLLFLSTLASHAQSKMLRTLEASDIDRIVIKGDQIFEMEVTSQNRTTIEMTTLLDGEYENDYQIIATKKNQVLEIQLVFNSFSVIPDNKRNAHKVVAATLKLLIPHEQKLEVTSDVGFLIAKGNYKSLLVNLQNGYFNFEGVAQYLRAETNRGNIYFTSKNTHTEAFSANGAVRGDNLSNGPHTAILKSIRGDIEINALEN